MKAAVVRDFGQPLRIEDIPMPEPGYGEILVRIETSGVCHTDIHAAHGEWAVKPALPLVPGHEGVGIIERVGPGVSLREGWRVAVPWLAWACGVCEFCASGRETLCLTQHNTGYDVPGCYAEYVVANAGFVATVPYGIDPLDAAPLTCAGVTAYKAVKVSGARPSHLVAVFGIGGLGHMAVQYARVAGASVVAVDLLEAKLALARRLGAEHVVNALVDDPAEAIQALGGADAAVVLAVSSVACEQAWRSLKRGGTMVLVGLPADNVMRLPIFETVMHGITVVGSVVGTRADLAETFELHAEHRTQVVREVRQLDQVNEAFEQVEKGQVDARLVFELR